MLGFETCMHAYARIQYAHTTYLCIKIYVLGPQFQRTRVRGSQGGQVQRVAMDLITLQCVCCNASQPQATFGNADPFIHACCEPLDALLIRALRSVHAQMTSTGRCYFCDIEVGLGGIFCNRQSCALRHMMHQRNMALWLLQAASSD